MDKAIYPFQQFMFLLPLSEFEIVTEPYNRSISITRSLLKLMLSLVYFQYTDAYFCINIILYVKINLLSWLFPEKNLPIEDSFSGKSFPEIAYFNFKESTGVSFFIRFCPYSKTGLSQSAFAKLG